MKTTYLLLGIGVLLVAGGLWFGRAAWRTHRQLVTLDVREVPLPVVLRQIESQTGKRIRAEKALDARITLQVTDKPLASVLDRLAEQAGARWATLYAVYDSSRALKALESALSGDGKIEPAGWKLLAPDLAGLTPPTQEGAGPVLRSQPHPDGSAPRSGPPMMMTARRMKNGPVIFSVGPGGQTEVWSPEELVVESALTNRLDHPENLSPTTQTADEMARKIAGHWTTYLAFHKSRMGVGFGGPHNPNERFANLTPEQRVQRARERLGLTEK